MIAHVTILKIIILILELVLTQCSNFIRHMTTLFSLQGNPVEFEFLRTLRELQSNRQITVTHGSVMRAGNTQQDLGKPGIGPNGPTKPVLIMEENLVINNTKRLQELFTKYYISSVEQGMCNPDELIECLKVGKSESGLQPIILS